MSKSDSWKRGSDSFGKEKNMTIKIHLTKQDIQNIIAEKFKVAPGEVYVECFMDYDDYGLDVRQIPNVRATVEQTEGLLNV